MRLGIDLKAREVIRGALRRIGAYSPAMPGPRPHDFDVALERLNVIVHELGTTEEVPWERLHFVVPLTAGTPSYDLRYLTSRPIPCDPRMIEHWQSAKLVILDQRRDPLDIWHVEDWNERDRQTRSGVPVAIYISRDDTPTLHPWPVPIISDRFKIEVYGQLKVPDLQHDVQGGVILPFPRGCQRWLELKLAHDISNGIITTLSGQERDAIRVDMLLAQQAALGARNDSRRPQFTEAYDW